MPFKLIHSGWVLLHVLQCFVNVLMNLIAFEFGNVLLDRSKCLFSVG